ncbi:MAG TPA: hypothetical protein VMT12_05995 [Syntrophales bacterium]|nr:hypothetical protein [Syntrophales bacterium]
MVYIIGSLIIYLVLALFFWSLCAVKNRSSHEVESMLERTETEPSFGDVLARRYSSVDGM